jgi:hypothetical protein
MFCVCAVYVLCVRGVLAVYRCDTDSNTNLCSHMFCVVILY